MRFINEDTFLTKIFEINLKYETNFSTLVVDNNSWNNGPYSILPIHEEIEKEGVIYK